MRLQTQFVAGPLNILNDIIRRDSETVSALHSLGGCKHYPDPISQPFAKNLPVPLSDFCGATPPPDERFRSVWPSEVVNEFAACALQYFFPIYSRAKRYPPGKLVTWVQGPTLNLADGYSRTADKLRE